jgi:hypothetical protein
MLTVIAEGILVNYNLINGGLIINVNGRHLISNLKECSTNADEVEGMFWFMNKDGTNIYYSDQNQNNALCRLDLVNKKNEVILKKPCYGVTLHNNWLYYVNEDDEKVYRCSKDGKSETRVINEKVNFFIIEDKYIYYATPDSIKKRKLSGRSMELVYDGTTTFMLIVKDKLAFADKNNQYSLAIMNLSTKGIERFPDISVSGLNTDGRYFYCINRLKNNSIYRIDIDTSMSIRICNKNAQYLHILSDELFFLVGYQWYKLRSSSGGPIKLLS